MSKLSGVSRLVDSGLLGVGMEMACGSGDFPSGPRVPRRLTADGASGISCRSRFSLNSPSGKGGGAEAFGIGGADGDGVDGTLLDAGVFTSTSGDLLDAGAFKSTSGDLLDAGVGG